MDTVTSATTADLDRYRELARGRPPEPYTYVALLGLSTFDPEKLLRAVAKGFAWKTFEHLVQNVGLPVEQVASAIGLPKRTRARRKAERRFAPDESDRLLRIARVYARALDLFAGDRDAAVRWLTQRKHTLGDAIPLELARTDAGAREIEATIDRIEQGVYT